MHNPFSIHSDRHVRALAARGVDLKASVSAEVLATTFGYRSSNAVREAAARGELTPPAATACPASGGEGLVAVLDPVARLPFSVHRSLLERGVRDRHADYCVSPYGNLLDLGALRGSATPVTPPGDDGATGVAAAPERPLPGPDDGIVALSDMILRRAGIDPSRLGDPEVHLAGVSAIVRTAERLLDGIAPDWTGRPGGGVADMTRQGHRFAEFVVSAGMARRDVVEAALREQMATKERLGAILVRHGHLTQAGLTWLLQEFRENRIATERPTTSQVPLDILERDGITIAAESATTLYVSTLSDEDQVRTTLGIYRPGMAVSFVPFDPGTFPGYLDSVRRSRSAPREAAIPGDGALDRILGLGVAAGASDIHIEPHGASYSVFHRREGVRGHVRDGSIEECRAVIDELKDRARLDIAERRIAQYGGFRIEDGDQCVGLRVAIVATVEGEQAIIRILDPDRVKPKLDDLGITHVAHWRRGISRQNGLCLICGATGSGKTTTLNSSIKEIDRFGKKIYTAEDPVEHRIPDVGQASMNPQVDLTFARSIKNFMRADPDVIVIGEVRDGDTARNAVKGADTGHLVLGTMSASTVLTVIRRMGDLGVADHELRSILRSVLVQTLVRTICRTCNGERIRYGRECTGCGGRGYAGRSVVSECASFDGPDDVGEVLALVKLPPGTMLPSDLPWPGIVDDAILKMREGVTTSDELIRVFGNGVRDAFERHDLDPRDFSLRAMRRPR